MDRFDYKAGKADYYVSSGLTPGDINKPVAWGSSSSFSSPLVYNLQRGASAQVIVEPILDNVLVVSFLNTEIRYLYNGVYMLTVGTDSTRIVASTGPVAIEIVVTDSEVDFVIDDITLTANLDELQASVEISLAPSGGVLYDKFIVGYDGYIGELIQKEPKRSVAGEGVFYPLSYDKWYDPQTVTADQMPQIDGYRIFNRKLSEANTSIMFYSDIDEIEKTENSDDWEPVEKIEYHGEDALTFRSKDPSFALAYLDTTIDHFVVPGAITTVEGEIYKNGDNIGSYFSHDCYKIEGSLTVESEGMTSVSILGYMPDTIISSLNPVVDYGNSNIGKMHIYTFQAQGSIELVSDDLYIAGLGINLDHEELMDHLTGTSQVSYADELPNLQPGKAINGEDEYSILDLQWNV